MKSRQFLSILVALIVSMIGAVSPAIADKLHLKDGRVLEGEVEREGEGFIYFKILIGGIAKTELFTSDQILRIEKDEAEASKGGDAASDDDAPTAMSSGSKPAQKRARTGDSGSEISDGATKVAFLSLEDMVGPLINGKAMVRFQGTAYQSTSLPLFMFAAVPNPGVVDVLNLATGPVTRVDANVFQPGLQSVPAVNVTMVADYFRQ